jgi:hypothetical protein
VVAQPDEGTIGPEKLLLRAGSRQAVSPEGCIDHLDASMQGWHRFQAVKL